MCAVHHTQKSLISLTEYNYTDVTSKQYFFFVYSFLIQKRAERLGKKASLYRVYVKVYGRRLVGAAVLKLIGEFFFFINPLAVGALTAYVTTLQYPPKETRASQILGLNIVE